MFSTAEAIECLSPAIQRCNVNVIFAGDSYTMHLFIGLADIVLGRAWNQELHDGETRRATLKEVQEDLHKAHNMNPSFPKLEFVCKSECYGSKQPFSKHCSDCMNVYTSSKQNKDTVAVVGVGVHILIKLKTVNATAEELKMFLKMANRTILVSRPQHPRPTFCSAPHMLGLDAGSLHARLIVKNEERRKRPLNLNFKDSVYSISPNSIVFIWILSNPFSS